MRGCRAFWSDGRFVDELSVLELQNDSGFNCIAVLIDGDLSGNTPEVLGLCDRIAQLCVLGRSGTLNRIREHFHRIVTESGKGVRQNVVATFVVSDKLLNRG